MKSIAGCVAWMILTAPFVTAGETIPYPPGLKLGGAAAYLGTGNYQPSPYFKHPDFYNQGNTSSLVILPNFKTYQQTTEYTCGPAVIVMAAYYRGVTLNEMEVARACGSSKKLGTSTEQMVNYLKASGWNVQSSLTKPKIGSLQFLRNQLNEGNPVMVEWIDWGGHWQIVIGYDDMGTINESDDILIMADSYDTSDHLQDGYYIMPADRFQYMWFDYNLLPKGQQNRQWIIFNR